MADQPPSPFSSLQIDFIHAEILPRLPSKSLLRFKSVSRSFNTLISSPSFIRRHLRHSDSSSTNRLLVIPATTRTLHIFNLDPPSSAASATFRWSKSSISVVGACNGLVLLVYFSCTLILLNPSTRTSLELYSIRSRANVGFGFDEESDDYKVVMVMDSHTNPRTGVKKTRVTSVYSVKQMKWKVVDRIQPDDSMEEQNGGVLIANRLLHWMFWKKKRRIGCFDIQLEKWVDDVVLPEYYYDSNHRNYLLEIGVLDGRLSASFENRVDSCYDVWVMREYGVQESWVKLLSVACSEDIVGGVAPVACRGVGSSEVLLRQRHNSKMFWYNRENGGTVEAEFPYYWELPPCVCKGSLVTLPGAKVFGDVYESDESAREPV